MYYVSGCFACLSLCGPHASIAQQRPEEGISFPRDWRQTAVSCLWVLGIGPGPLEEAKCSQLPSHSISPPMAAFKVGFHYYFNFSGEIRKLDHLFKALGAVEILQMCLLPNQMLLYSTGYGIILTSILDQATRWRWDPGLVLTACDPAGIPNTMEMNYKYSHSCLIVWADFLF